LTQYVKTGLLLDDYQFDKIVTNRDLKDVYLHNRSIADKHADNLTKKEYSFFSSKQKESYYGNMDDDKKLEKAIRLKDSDMVRYLVEEKGIKIDIHAVSDAISSNNLALVKYLVDEKKQPINDYAVGIAVRTGNLELVKYLVDEKGAKISNVTNVVDSAILSNNLALVKYLVDEKKQPISNYAVTNASWKNNLELVRYLVDEKGAK
jgi:hypothetical protein